MVHLVDLQHVFIITARKRSLGQGNIFTNVCSSVQGEGVCIQEGGLHRGGWADPPPNQILWDTANDRVVRILLECILVLVMQKIIHG